ncbi:hypothetical protein PoB_003581200 [Plakobranchus ocellatus]|uniref:Uncharacterized protein n=1 Tax=Plakobranchus ocellatus TaxID=259542 RepID=A0AAV4APU1_9GAST|nr:hypothetical protein PoB_003581200 [Plakobranchus ocellatus]
MSRYPQDCVHLPTNSPTSPDLSPLAWKTEGLDGHTSLASYGQYGSNPVSLLSISDPLHSLLVTNWGPPRGIGRLCGQSSVRREVARPHEHSPGISFRRD